MSLKVKIHKPAKSVTQSGRAKGNKWVLEYETISARTPDDLTGWVSSNDTLNQVKIKFDTAQEAVEYAQKNGWKYTLLPSQDRKIPPKKSACRGLLLFSKSQ